MQPTIREVILDLINKPFPRSHSNESNQPTTDDATRCPCCHHSTSNQPIAHDAIITPVIKPLPMKPS